MKNLNKISSVSQVLGSLIAASMALTACGSNPTPAPVTTSPGTLNNTSCIPGSWGCTNTQVWGNQYGCVPVGNVTDASNRQLRKSVCYPLAAPSGTFYVNQAPRLTPEDPSGYGFGGATAYTTNTMVRPGDRVLFAASGGYYVSNSWFQFTTSWSDKCRSTPLTGSTPLMASDGTHSYVLGASADIRIQAQGMLRIGFDYDGNYSSGCTNLSISKFEVHHCEDSAGTTYPCP